MDTMAGPPNPNGTNGSGSNFRRNRGVNWTEEETEQLLEAWSQRDVQALLEHGPHNRQAFERVSFHLAQHQMDKTPSQCREKIKKLKTIYRNLTTGQGKISRKVRNRIVQKLYQVMGGMPASSVTLTEPKSPSAPTSQHGAQLGSNNIGAALPDDFSPHFQPSLIGPSGDFMADRSSASEDPSSSEDDEPVEMEPARPANAPIMTSTPSKRNNNRVIGVTSKKSSRHGHKKSGRSRNKHSAVYFLIDKLIASQAASNERFAALEERRLLLDKELEEKRLEAEARRQEAQRQHELQLLSTMAQQMSCVLKSLNPGAILRVGDPSKSQHVEVVNGCGEYASDTNAVYSTI